MYIRDTADGTSAGHEWRWDSVPLFSRMNHDFASSHFTITLGYCTQLNTRPFGFQWPTHKIQQGQRRLPKIWTVDPSLADFRYAAINNVWNTGRFLSLLLKKKQPVSSSRHGWRKLPSFTSVVYCRSSIWIRTWWYRQLNPQSINRLHNLYFHPTLIRFLSKPHPVLSLGEG
jgi:hypothetical protein